MRAFRLFNGLNFTQNCWVPVSLPFAKGECQPGQKVLYHRPGSKRIATMKPLDRWEDGSLRHGLADVEVENFAPLAEVTYEYELAEDAKAPSLEVPDITGARLVVIIDGIETPVLSWATTYVSESRVEFAGTARHGELTIRAWATLWSGQTFADVVLSIGNEDLARTLPRPEPIFVSDVRVRFEGMLASPTYGTFHGVETLGSAEFRILGADHIGDGQRWMTGFNVLFIGKDGSTAPGEIAAAYAWGAYRMIGLSEPDAEDEALALGLHGRLRGGVWPLLKSDAVFPQQSRQIWEEFALSKLNDPAVGTRWSGGGFWLKDEGSSGFHSDWGPCATGRDGKAMSPMGYHRWRALCMTRQRAAMWWGYPLASGFAPPHPRQGMDWQWHGGTTNGWQRSCDPAHREEGVLGTTFQRFGEEWMRGALLQSAALACATARGNETSFGEGRWAARVLERKVWGFLVGSDGDRAAILANLIPWSSSLNTNLQVLPGSNPPIHTFGILWPGGQGYPTALLQAAGLPTDQPLMRLIFTEEQTLGSIAAALIHTGIPALADAGLKVAQTWKRLVQPTGQLSQVILPDGRTAGPFVSTWAIPGLLKARTLLPAITELTAAANYHESIWLNHWNWDGANFCQA